MTAHGETKSLWAWGHDQRCFIRPEAFYARVTDFPRQMSEIDVEAALCLTRKLWHFYRRYGYLDPELLNAELDG